MSKSYPLDLTDEQWELLSTLNGLIGLLYYEQHQLDINTLRYLRRKHIFIGKTVSIALIYCCFNIQ